MITKFVLMIWIGSMQSQSISVLTFDTLAECDGVKDSLVENVNYLYGVDANDVKCHPYTFNQE
jgi:hypothetical protein